MLLSKSREVLWLCLKSRAPEVKWPLLVIGGGSELIFPSSRLVALPKAPKGLGDTCIWADVALPQFPQSTVTSQSFPGQFPYVSERIKKKQLLLFKGHCKFILSGPVSFYLTIWEDNFCPALNCLDHERRNPGLHPPQFWPSLTTIRKLFANGKQMKHLHLVSKWPAYKWT